MQKSVTLKRGKEESLLRFHPWIFSGAIADIKGAPDEGDIVDVYTHDGKWIAVGHIQVGSIAVRVLSFKQEPVDADFWFMRLRCAVHWDSLTARIITYTAWSMARVIIFRVW